MILSGAAGSAGFMVAGCVTLGHIADPEVDEASCVGKSLCITEVSIQADGSYVILSGVLTASVC